MEKSIASIHVTQFGRVTCPPASLAGTASPDRRHQLAHPEEQRQSFLELEPEPRDYLLGPARRGARRKSVQCSENSGIDRRLDAIPRRNVDRARLIAIIANNA